MGDDDRSAENALIDELAPAIPAEPKEDDLDSDQGLIEFLQTASELQRHKRHLKEDEPRDCVLRIEQYSFHVGGDGNNKSYPLPELSS